MAINIDYSPIDVALGLARQGGLAQRQRQVAAQDLQFIQMMQQAQADQDRQFANEIQIGAGIQNDRQRTTLAAQAQQQEIRQAELARQQQAQLQQNSLGVQKQKLDAEQAAAAQKQQALAGYVQNFVPQGQQAQAGAFAAATGKLPETVIPQNPTGGIDLEYRKADMEYKRLERQLAAADRALKLVRYDGDNLDHLSQGQSATVPGAVKGQEIQFQQAQQKRDQIEASMQRIESVLTGGPQVQMNPALLQAAAQQQAQAGAPAQQGGTPVVHNAQEYAALPRGATYIDSADGKTYTKR